MTKNYNYIWAFNVKGDGEESSTYFTNLSISENNNIYWSGYRNESPSVIDLDPNRGIPFNISPVMNERKALLVKYNQQNCPKVTASFNCPDSLSIGCSLPIAIYVDMTESPEPNHLLGGFSGTLNWDTDALVLSGVSSVSDDFTGFVQVDSSGSIRFNGINSSGQGGRVAIFQTTFEVIEETELEEPITLDFSSLNAAGTFANLLSDLEVENCDLDIISSQRLLGDVNSDSSITSTDALIILSYDVGMEVTSDIADLITMGLGDINGDGLTNSADALIILSYDAGISVPFPLGELFCPAEMLEQERVSQPDQVDVVVDLKDIQELEVIEVNVWMNLPFKDGKTWLLYL